MVRPVLLVRPVRRVRKVRLALQGPTVLPVLQAQWEHPVLPDPWEHPAHPGPQVRWEQQALRAQSAHRDRPAQQALKALSD